MRLSWATIHSFYFLTTKTKTKSCTERERMEKLNSFGERLREGGAEIGRKMSAKVKEMVQISNKTQADRLVDEATAEGLEEPDWSANLRILGMLNSGALPFEDTARAIKRRIALASYPSTQYLALTLLETLTSNCDSMLSYVSAHKVLQDIVKVAEDPSTIPTNRNKALQLIQAWGSDAPHLQYLPVFHDTYKSLIARGVTFPGQSSVDVSEDFILDVPPPYATSTRNSSSISTFEFQLTEEQKQEILDVARNSVELLSSVLTSSPEQEVLKDDLTSALVNQCRLSQASIQKLVQSSGDNEILLSEGLNINDDLQHVLLKYEEMMKPKKLESFQSEPASIPVTTEENSQTANHFQKLTQPSENAAASQTHGMMLSEN